MAIDLYIPRLEWNEFSVAGLTTTNASPVVTGFSSTDSIKVGMIVTGAGVLADTRIVSKTATTVTMSQDANASGTTSLTFFERFDFQYPPTKDSEDNLKADVKTTQSLSGSLQTQVNFVEAIRALEFWFLTQDERDSLKDDFFLAWAVFGKSFRFFVDKADTGFNNYELKQYQFDDERQRKKHPEFLYKLSMQMRRVVL